MSSTSFQNYKFNVHPHGIYLNITGMIQVANDFRIPSLLPGVGVPLSNNMFYTLLKSIIMLKLSCISNIFNHLVIVGKFGGLLFLKYPFLSMC